jgi:DHA2 family multidrug resistance protein
MIEKAAFVWSVDDAWAMLAAFALLGVLVVPFAWRTQASAAAIKGN